MQVGQSVTIYDGDHVEAHNPTSQQFTRSHIGQNKAECLVNQATEWSDEQIEYRAVPRMVEDTAPLQGHVFLCLDNMATRLNIMKHSVFSQPDVDLVVETRMDATVSQVFAFNPNTQAHQVIWRQFWFSDEDAENQLGCNGPIAIPTATTITGSLAVQQLLNYYKQPGRFNHHVTLNLNTMHARTRSWPDTLDE
jgi:molybdopterin/thiamine biosynthesis adenylyltransferase